MNRISVSEEMKMKTPALAGFCELINYALSGRPDMTLAEFAGVIESVHREERYERLVAAERKQFGISGEEI